MQFNFLILIALQHLQFINIESVSRDFFCSEIKYKFQLLRHFGKQTVFCRKNIRNERVKMKNIKSLKHIPLKNQIVLKIMPF